MSADMCHTTLLEARCIKSFLKERRFPSQTPIVPFPNNFFRIKPFNETEFPYLIRTMVNDDVERKLQKQNYPFLFTVSALRTFGDEEKYLMTLKI